jgi:signal transduction histidine kinase
MTTTPDERSVAADPTDDTAVTVTGPGVRPAAGRGPETPSSRSRSRVAGRAWDVAAILAAWFGGLVLLGEAAEIRDLSEEALFLHFVAGCVLSLALWWRRSHPLVVATFLAAVAVVADGAGVAGLIGLYTVASLRRGRPVAAIVLINLLGGIAYAVVYPDMAEPHLVNLVLSIALISAMVAMGMAARARRELIESLRERAARAEQEAGLRADRLRALERERIAREMHDALAHRISMVSLHAGALQIRPDLTPEEVAKAAATIRDSAHHALEDLREILGVLRAGPDDARRPQPGLQHLDELISDARRAGIDVTATDRLGDRRVSPSLGRTVYRLVQEGLTNAGKHAPGSPVSLLLERLPNGNLHVHISNLLSPFPRLPNSGPTPSARRAVPAPAPPGRRAVSGPALSGPASSGPASSGFALSGHEPSSHAPSSHTPSGPAPSGSGPFGRSDAGGAVPGAGSGLIGLTERVELVGGRLRHGVHGDPRAGLAFDLEAWLPWPTPSGS